MAFAQRSFTVTLTMPLRSLANFTTNFSEIRELENRGRRFDPLTALSGVRGSDIKEHLTASVEIRHNFVQTTELQIRLKNYDTQAFPVVPGVWSFSVISLRKLSAGHQPPHFFVDK
jgi:hypothetical protein